jgi:D-glycero-D-manno-heptose 1,7-bisphosphate phosphatase
MDARAGLIVLDRDGVLNRTIPNPAEPRPDSPLRVDEVAVFPWVPAALRALTEGGWTMVIASNQPAAAKGKATRAALDAVHAAVLTQAQSAGGVIQGSFICFHRSEDGCDCRKPRAGLLRAAFAAHPGSRPEASWMVGDRAVDVLAGQALGLQTALVPGDSLSDELAALAGGAGGSIKPSFCGRDLRDFAEFLLGKTLSDQPF